MVARAEIQAFADRIAEDVDVERVILFGSHAYGEPDDASDVDVLVLSEFEGRSLDEALRLLLATDPHFPVDLILRRPGEARDRYRLGDPIVRAALDRGVVLFERSRS